jgi:hypothetical protein
MLSPGMIGRLRLGRGSQAASTPSVVTARIRCSVAWLVTVRVTVIGMPAPLRTWPGATTVGGSSSKPRDRVMMPSSR